MHHSILCLLFEYIFIIDMYFCALAFYLCYYVYIHTIVTFYK